MPGTRAATRRLIGTPLPNVTTVSSVPSPYVRPRPIGTGSSGYDASHWSSPSSYRSRRW